MSNYELQDDRSDEQKETHTIVIRGRDTFLSGWGRAEGGASHAGWAVEEKDLHKVLAWVESRSDMANVAVVDADDAPPRGCVHYHIYVVTEGHPALV